MMPTISEDESCQVQEFIEVRFKGETNLEDSPWEAMKVDETQTNVDLERQYRAR